MNTASYHISNLGSFAHGLRADLDGYVHLTAAAVLKGRWDAMTEIDDQWAADVAAQNVAATREAEAAATRWQGGHVPRITIDVTNLGSEATAADLERYTDLLDAALTEAGASCEWFPSSSGERYEVAVTGIEIDEYNRISDRVFEAGEWA